MNRREVWVTAPYRRVDDDDDDTQVYKKPWVGLTDEEVISLMKQFPNRLTRDVAQAIEAKLRSKNYG